MYERSEFWREMKLVRRWDKATMLIRSEIRVLDWTPTLSLIRGWDDKDKRCFLKKLREVKRKPEAWAEILEEVVY